MYDSLPPLPAPRSAAELRQMSPVSLAFLGDAVYELLVRAYLIESGIKNANRLHLKAIGLVNAGAQARAIPLILPMLTDEEKEFLRRGRNANTSHIPKNADPLDYRRATGFEALFGYLYLRGDGRRLLCVFRAAVGAQREENSGDLAAADPA